MECAGKKAAPLLVLATLIGGIGAQTDLKGLETKCKCVGAKNIYQTTAEGKIQFGTSRINGLYFNSRRRSSGTTEGDWSRYSRSNYDSLESFPEDYGTFCAEWDPADKLSGTKWCFVEKTDGCNLDAQTISDVNSQCNATSSDANVWSATYTNALFDMEEVYNNLGAPIFRDPPTTTGTPHPPYLSGDRSSEGKDAYCGSGGTVNGAGVSNRDGQCKALYISTIPCGANQCKKELCGPIAGSRANAFQPCEDGSMSAAYPCGDGADTDFYHGVVYWMAQKVLSASGNTPIQTQYIIQGGVEPFVYDFLPTDKSHGVGEFEVQDVKLTTAQSVEKEVKQSTTIRLLKDSVVHFKPVDLDTVKNDQISKDYPCAYTEGLQWGLNRAIAITKKMTFDKLKYYLADDALNTNDVLLRSTYTTSTSDPTLVSTGITNNHPQWHGAGSSATPAAPLTIDTTKLCSFQETCPQSDASYCKANDASNAPNYNDKCGVESSNDGASYWYVSENCFNYRGYNQIAGYCSFGKIEIHDQECPRTLETSNLSPSKTGSTAIRNSTATMLEELQGAEKRCGDYMRQKIRDAVHEKPWSTSNTGGDTAKRPPYQLGMHTIRDMCRFSLEDENPGGADLPAVKKIFPSGTQQCEKPFCCEQTGNTCANGDARVTVNYPSWEYKECVLELGAYQRCSDTDKQTHAKTHFFDKADGFLQRFNGWCPVVECALGPLCGKFFDDCMQDLQCKAVFDYAFTLNGGDCDFQDITCTTTAWKEAFRRYNLAYSSCGKYGFDMTADTVACFQKWPEDEESNAAYLFNRWLRCQRDCESGKQQRWVKTTVTAQLSSNKQGAFKDFSDGKVSWTPASKEYLCKTIAGMSGIQFQGECSYAKLETQNFFKEESILGKTSVELSGGYNVFVASTFTIRWKAKAGADRFEAELRKKFPLSGNSAEKFTSSTSATNFVGNGSLAVTDKDSNTHTIISPYKVNGQDFYDTFVILDIKEELDPLRGTENNELEGMSSNSASPLELSLAALLGCALVHYFSSEH